LFIGPPFINLCFVLPGGAPPPPPPEHTKRSELCSFLDIDGVRGDIVTNKAVRAFVAYEGRTAATTEDVERIAPLVLNHRCAAAAGAGERGEVGAWATPCRPLLPRHMVGAALLAAACSGPKRPAAWGCTGQGLPCKACAS
jgi:hypothetical protein